MKQDNTTQFYARFVMVPALVVMSFVFYCINDLTIDKQALATTIDQTMESVTYVDTDALAFVPATKPNTNYIEVASK